MATVTPPTTADIDDAAPARGRPRSKQCGESILRATLELAGEFGINRMSMDDVALRAGVSKATIYRRWSSKEMLVIDALRSVMKPIYDFDSGSLGTDLRLYLGELSGRMSARNRDDDVLPHLIEVATHDPMIRDSLDDYVQFRRVPLRTILARAVERGEIEAETDLDTIIDVLIGPFIYRRLLTGGPMDTDFIERLLTVVLPGR